MTNPKLDLGQQLDRFRRKLLDLTGRNNLVSHKLGARTVQILDELPDAMFEHLVGSGRSFTFEPRSEEELDLFGDGAEGDDLHVPSAEPLRQAPRHHDDRLQTDLAADKLEARLGKIRQDANSFIQETGVNYLYLAIGFLRWYEAPHSEKSHAAPLVLIPIHMDRGYDELRGRYVFPATWSGEEVQGNPCLQEKLKRDFGLKLPELDDELPEAYIERVGETVLGRGNPDDRWRVERRACLGFFSFSKLLMFRDLSAEAWAEDELEGHLLLRQLFEGSDEENNDPTVPGYASDHAIDELAPHEEVALVDDADSSQHSALVDIIARGRSLVIEGPPGTGKSQTITNAIAAAMAAGKTVLFVSEKLAALEVVRRRLDGLGLGAMCLELHSNKAKPKEVFDELKTRLGYSARPPQRLEEERALLEKERKKLAKYLEAAGQIVGPHHEPLYEAIWRVIDLRGLGHDAVREIDVDVDCDRLQLEDRLSFFDELARHAAEVGEPDQHPWRWLHCPRVRSDDAAEVIAIVERLREAREELWREAECFLDRSGVKWPALPRFLVERPELPIDAVAVPDGPFSVPAAAPLARERPAWKTASALLDDLATHGRLVPEVRAVTRRPIEEAARDAAVVEHLLAKTVQPASLDGLTIGEVGKLVVLVDNVRRAMGDVEANADRLERLGHGRPRDLHEYKVAVDRHRLMTDPAASGGEGLVAEHFYATADRALQDAKVHADRLAARRAELEQTFAVGDLPVDADLAGLRRTLRASGASWTRLLSGEYRRAKRTIKGVLQPKVRFDPLDLAIRLEHLEQHLKVVADFHDNSKVRQHLGPLFAGKETPWKRLGETIRWAKAARDAGVSYDEANRLFTLLTEDADTPSTDRLADADELLRSQVLADELKPIVGDNAGAASAWRLDDLRERFDAVSTDLATLRDTLRAFELRQEASLRDTIDAAKAVMELDALLRRFDEHRPYRDLMGEEYHGPDTDADALRGTMAWLERVQHLGLPEGVVQWLAHGNARAKADALHASLASMESLTGSWRTVLEELEAWGKVADGADLLDQQTEAEHRPLDADLAVPDGLGGWAGWCRAVDRGRQLGVEAFVDLVASGGIEPASAGQTYELTLFDRIVRRAIQRSRVLNEFSRQEIEQTRERFRDLDEKVLKLNREEVAHRAARRKIPHGIRSGRVADKTQLGLIEHEIEKQKRHVRIRQLVLRAADALQGLKPCFMMSPLSVAQFLPPGSIRFDLVVIDEASQVRPEDALGAAARGKQIVVVGDPKQLPPTNFWSKANDDEVDPNEETVADDSESILEVALKAFGNARRLKWHYRSRHESLIAFSNDRFYDGDLVVFPSPTTGGADVGRLGVYLHRVPDGVFVSKQGNLPEARAVADAVVRHAIEQPSLSLGVGTFNGDQRDLIDRCIDKRCEEDSRVREAVERLRHADDPLFVKNLENLQGDERDVVFISYTYGPSRPGGPVMQRFGPITHENGWRRLNVLITRARWRVEVFTSLDPSDIKAEPDKSRGVHAMKDYLTFASVGRLPDRGLITGRQPDSPFEEAVIRCVERSGFRAVPQVGVAGYFIDIGVLRPGHDDEFLLGIECDGAGYHSAKSARDRDRLREQVIRDRGWVLHRIWSTDWFYNQKAEELRLQETLLAAAK